MNKVFFPNLNGVRAFAALSVIVFHHYGVSVINGELGVDLFFVLSGFLISFLLLTEKENFGGITFGKFYMRRILRIWPLYFLILLLSIIFYISTSGWNKDLTNILPYYLLFSPNLVISPLSFAYGRVLWSVGAEEQFYLIWPWVIEKINIKKILFFLFLTILVFTFSPHFIDFLNVRYFNNNELLHNISWAIPKTGFAAMATGAVVAYFAIYQKEKFNVIFSKIFQYILLLVLGVSWWLNLKIPYIEKEYFCILFALVIANAALNDKVVFSLENRVFNYLGKISFGLYVFHLIGLDLSIELFKYFNVKIGQPYHLIFILGVILTILLSSLSYNFFEKPFLKIKNSKKYTVVSSTAEKVQ